MALPTSPLALADGSSRAANGQQRGDEAVERVRELTDGFGVHSVLECVGLEQSMLTAIGIARPGGAVGRVGVPQDETIPASQPALHNNLTVSRGPAPGRDGTLRNSVTMWVVCCHDDVDVRSVYGRGSSWFRGAQTRHKAHIQAGGVDKDVLLDETDEVNDELDAANRTKYHRYAASIIDAITSSEARAATLKLVPLNRPLVPLRYS